MLSKALTKLSILVFYAATVIFLVASSKPESVVEASPIDAGDPTQSQPNENQSDKPKEVPSQEAILEPNSSSHIGQTVPPQKITTTNEKNKPVFFGYLRLVGTAVFNYNPLKNKAVLEDLATAEQQLLTLGAIVPYGAKIIQIRENKIILEKEGTKRELTITGSLDDSKDLDVVAEKGYKRVSASEWLISPNHLIKSTDGIVDLLRQTDLRPYSPEGRLEGFLVGEIKPEGIVKELGLNSGDVINTIDGETIDSLSHAYEVYQKMRSKPTINMTLSRGQEKINLSYHVIPGGMPKYKVKDALKSPYAAKIFSAAQ